MARNWRVRMRRGVMWAIVVLLLGGWTLRVAGASGGDDTAPMPHVRSTNAVIAGAIVEAQSRSSTFRSLVRTIDATDGIVYVERGTCRHGVRACLSLSVVSGGGYRLLRILISHVEDVVSLIATIGHELFHAIEVLREPAIRTAADAYLFYVREAPTAQDHFETDAAIRAGLVIGHELRQR
jgi:hypothetical protein